MRPYISSLRYALEGLCHAFATERNLKLFGALYLLSLVLSATLSIDAADWQMVIFSGGIFLAVELINTALERFTDAFDRHSQSIHTSAIKATKDIAAAASLVCALAWAVILCMIVLPHLPGLRIGGIGAGM